MGEMRSDSAGSWDNVDMRMPLSYYRYVDGSITRMNNLPIQYSLSMPPDSLTVHAKNSLETPIQYLLVPYSRALCVERMNNDDLNESLSEVEAVMRLLEEKERDLELAARIGQTLLADNRKLKVLNHCVSCTLWHL